MAAKEKFSRFSLKLQTKLQISFLFIGFLSIAVTGWQSFESARSSIETITFDRLTSIRETKKRQIEAYFLQIHDQAVALAEDRTTIEAARAFNAAFQQTSLEKRGSLGRVVRSGGQEPGSAFTEYLRIHALYRPVLENFRQRFRFDDLLVVDAATGEVVYSATNNPDFATNLLDGPYRKTGLAKVFRETRQANQPDFVGLTDFAPDPASDNAPASFVAAPLIENGTTIGILILQVPLRLINEVMTSHNNWGAEGLGETGETYIVGSDFKMRTDSRFFIQEPEEYFQRLQKISTSDSIIQRIHLLKTSILLQEVRTEATTDALRGSTNTKIIRDYRGIPVLSSYTPLNIPGVSWVMLAEIDTSEAFNSVLVLRERLILIGLGLLFLAALVGMFISRTISKPILDLAKATEQFGRGDLSYRAQVRSQDEIGLLASAFNNMAESTMQNTRQLQSEIAERQRAQQEVGHSHQRLRDLSAHLQTVREEERKSLAREIHDELGQALTALKLHLTLIEEDLRTVGNESNERIASMLNLIDATIRSVKRMITALRPRLLDDLGLTAAIEWQAEEFQERTGISCTLSIVPPEITLDADRSTALFRIFQETLTNVARHSHASAVSVDVSNADGVIQLQVTDNGTGIAEEQVNDSRSFGLIGIRERASYWGGMVNIRGIKERGTTLTVQIPTASTKGIE
jgi:signal transduction histidine kinase